MSHTVTSALIASTDEIFPPPYLSGLERLRLRLIRTMS